MLPRVVAFTSATLGCVIAPKLLNHSESKPRTPVRKMAHKATASILAPPRVIPGLLACASSQSSVISG